MNTPLNVRIDQRGIDLNSIHICQQLLLDDYRSILGDPSRVHEYGPPAPYGHSNNKAIIYDHLGIYLFQHHKRLLIRGVAIVFDCNISRLALGNPYRGQLTFWEVSLTNTPHKEEFPEVFLNGARSFGNVFVHSEADIGNSVEFDAQDVVRVVEVTIRK
jgi:hypothetical protein